MHSEIEKPSCPLRKEHIEELCDVSYPVVPGAPFARLITEALPDALKGEKAESVVPTGTNIIHDSEAGTLSASLTGMLVESDVGLTVESVWRLSEDSVEVLVDMYPRDCFGSNLDAKSLAGELRDLAGVVDLDTENLGAVVLEVVKENAIRKGVVVARGKPPKDGTPGEFRLLFVSDRDAGEVQDNGSVDHRERGSFTYVKEGEHVATLIPPTMGVEGSDALGNVISALDGQPVQAHAGKGVVCEDGEDGSVIFKAGETGVVMLVGNTLSISDVVEIDSDVDMASGNVHADKGSVRIKGTVTSGFTVTAQDNIVVDEVVENATIKAGGDLVVAGGLLMDEGGTIEVGGSIQASFIRNATIRAGGDVTVKVDIVNSDIQTSGKIIADSDHGSVQGGTYVCGGMDAREVGNESGIPTFVTLLSPKSETDDTDAERVQIQDTIAQLEKYIGTDDIKNTLSLAPKEDRRILFELFQIKMKLLGSMHKLDENEQKNLALRSKELAKIWLRAIKTAYPGVSISIADKTMTLSRAEQASKIHWDSEEQIIVVTGL